jgi:amino acid transporter
LTYGLVFITPIAPVAVFGIVFNASRGMVPLVYVIGLVAMIFIAFSYMSMSTAFPVAGSVYTYAARSLGRIVGFFAGWAMLLDYILLPTLIYVVSAIAVQAVFPAFPKALVIVAMVAVTTLVNYFGIETTARTSFVLLAFQLALLALLAVLGGIAVAHHVAGASVSFAPFYNPALVTPGLIFGALSLAVLSFLGFDAISTLSEESLHGAPAIGRATMVSLCLSAALFIGQTYIASLFVLGRTNFPSGTATDGAYYSIAALIGGPAFKFLLAVPGILLSSLAGAITAQAATARLLFGMARDGELPRALAYVEPKRKVPERTVFLVAGVTLVTGLLLADQLELLTSMVNFGALFGFLLLQVSVFVHFVVRNGSRNWLRHAVIPAIGFLILTYVLWNAEANAKIAGISWLAVGLAVFAGLALQRRTATR